MQMRQCAWKIFKCILLRLCVQMVKCLLTTFMDPLFKGTQNTPLLKAEFALANAPLQSFGEMNSQCWYFANGHSVYLADSLCSWPYLKRAPLWRCGDENFFISVVRKSPPKPQCIHVSVFEFEGKCIILRLPFHISEDLMEFSEGFEGKFWCSYYNIWISIADFGILVYLSTFIYWIYSDSETLDDTTYFLFMHLTKTFLLFFFFPNWHCIQDNIWSVHVFLGNRTHDLDDAAQFSIYLNGDVPKGKLLTKIVNYKWALWNKLLRNISIYSIRLF